MKHLAIEISKTYIKIGIVKVPFLNFKNEIKNIETIKLNEKNLKESIIFYKNKYKTTISSCILILKGYKIIKRFESFFVKNLKDIDKIVKNNISEYLPINKEKHIYDYSILSQDDSSTKILLASIEKTIINNILEPLKELKMKCLHIDFYDNVIRRFFEKHIKEKAFVVYKNIDKLSFLFLEDNRLINIREIENINIENLKKEISIAFSFFSNEIYNIKKVYLLEKIPDIKDFFLKMNIEVIDSNYFFEEFNIDIDKISFNGVMQNFIV